MDINSVLEKLHVIDSENRHLARAQSVLRWDQETYMPEKGVQERADQVALIEGIAHERFTSPETGRLLNEAGSTSENPGGDERLSALERDFLKTLRRDYDKAALLPGDFVTDAARAEGLSQAAWVNARQENDFAAFLPHLTKMIEFARRRAEYWGWKDNPYDGLLDIYEPGMGQDAITAVFAPLKDELSALMKKIAAAPRVDDAFLSQEYSVEKQADFSRELLKRLGFDTERGRLDISAHPFTTMLGSDDVRITTRFYPRQLLSGIFATIHEAGHAFYEMDLPHNLRGTCLADGASMGIHESQSRLWENVIARSRHFWEGMFPVLRSYFPAALDGVPIEGFYRAINRAQPSLIRVEADEVSYSLHVILRFELERDLFSGALNPADLPKAWREKMRNFLGIEPETDAGGVLQDVHWSMGAFGYFPSYALGNLYGSAFWQKLNEDLPDTDTMIAEGNFAPIRTWLRDTIYVHGRRLKPPELLKTVTVGSLSPQTFLEYINSKYTGIYGL